jgi:hypothetical protein
MLYKFITRHAATSNDGKSKRQKLPDRKGLPPTESARVKILRRSSFRSRYSDSSHSKEWEAVGLPEALALRGSSEISEEGTVFLHI